jgi:hypothetical protein
MVLAPAPVGIDFLILSASTTLFDVEVIAFVVEVYCSRTAVAPDDSQMATINLDLHHLTMPV